MSGADQPALTPPPGQESNFIDPPDGNARAHFALAFSIILVLSGVSIRAYSKIFCMKKVSFQDVLVLLSLGTYAGCLWVLYTYLLTVGYFVHQWDVRAEEVPRAFRIIYLGMVQYEATMALLKVSIVSEWIQIFVPSKTRNSFFITSLIVIVINVAYYLASILTTSLICPTRGTLCDRSLFVFASSASINLASDLVLLVLPIKAIWKLQLPQRKKINISFVFGIGLIAVAAAVARLRYSIGLLISPDKTYGISDTTLWCLTEITVAYLVFCAPAAPKAFQNSRVLRRIFDSSNSSSPRCTKNSTQSDGRRRVTDQQSHQQPFPAKHSWQRIDHDETYNSSDSVNPGVIPLQTFSASAKGGLQVQRWGLEEASTFYTVLRHLQPTGQRDDVYVDVDAQPLQSRGNYNSAKRRQTSTSPG
ncbi:hypothetical protein CHU98_g728 [Xylaria longipes]|nr:hypothetical protein CHU98_g728 [Xylaria longipes]